MAAQLVGLTEIEQAAQLLQGVSHRTPLEPSRALSEIAGVDVHLKCENLQRTGAFKIRGAYNCIARLSDEQKGRGVVAASAGNHAQGLALAASLLGVQATVFMPEGAALPKLEATTGYGAKVVLEGAVYDEAYRAAQEFAEKTSAVMVPPFDHPDVIAGQGTIALEVVDQLPEVASIVVAIGGGGLISGIAAGIKALRPDVKVIGVEPAGSAAMKSCVDAGRMVTLDSLTTIADGLATKQAGEITFAHVQELVDEIVTVSDEEIAEALLLTMERAKMVVEPAGAASVAAVMKRKVELPGPSVAVLSGGNVDPLLLLHVMRFGMSSAGRYFYFRTRIGDRPGELHRLLGVLAEVGGNVVGVEHHREGPRLRRIDEVEVALQVETRGHDHVALVEEAVQRAGYSVERL